MFESNTGQATAEYRFIAQGAAVGTMRVLAGTTNTQRIKLMQVYIDGVKKYDALNAGSSILSRDGWLYR